MMQTLYKVEKIAIEYEDGYDRYMPQGRKCDRELIGVFETAFDAEVFQFETSGELIRFKTKKAFLREMADELGLDDWRKVRELGDYRITGKVNSRYRIHNTTTAFKQKDGTEIRYRIDTMSFFWRD